MKLSIPDMSCGHCRASVEKAVRAIDGGAQIAVDLGARTVDLQTSAPPAALLKALADEGYPALVLD